MKIQMTHNNYSLECNCYVDNLTLQEIDDLLKIIKELKEKLAEAKRKRVKNEKIT